MVAAVGGQVSATYRTFGHCPTVEPLARLKAQQSLILATEVGKSNRLLERLLFSKVNWR